ncbi:hypothetical protein AVEN_16153-1 [Araneus ventricosus]|uniref:Tesmin/TSO1-like CXC domain-containing protein n=1 Tax=Araneus ventricosus TaxID=182803 RepID=A0A4Y2L1G5_ARAVE|nr:hypothetical protein AVEN_16153-1 [Araneus ventricosus]
MFFTFELSPFPLSLFNEEGIRKGTKSSLFSAFTLSKIDAVQGKNNFVVVDGGHLLHKVVWQRNVNFGDIAKSYLTYLQTHYGSNVAVVFDGYPSDVNGKSTKSAERIRRANLHSSHEIIFNEATCPEISQEQFLANERNKVRFIDLLKKFLQKANVTVKQAVEDADVLIVETAVSVKSQYDNIFVVGENIDFSVLLTVGCNTTSALFGLGKTKFCSLLEKNRHFEEKIQVFFNSEATIDQVAKAGETFLIHLYGGNPRTSACDLNHLRYTLFTQSATKARSTLARLPPTVDAARFHALRSYLQTQKWLGHEKNPFEWGWIPTRFCLSPRKIERDAAPESLLKIISCNCKNACGCQKAGLICSYLCNCSLGEACENVSDINLLEDSIEMKTTRHR